MDVHVLEFESDVFLAGEALSDQGDGSAFPSLGALIKEAS
jgi:hypothetical protein